MFAVRTTPRRYLQSCGSLGKTTAVTFLKSLAIHALLILTSTVTALYAAEYWLNSREIQRTTAVADAIRKRAKGLPNRISTLNGDGFRSRGFDEPRSDDQFRILLLGDSITYGSYLPYVLTYPALLERRLGETTSSRNYRVYAVAKPGLSVFDNERNLIAFGPKIKPDLVVYGFCFNDAKDGPLGRGVGRAKVFNRYGINYVLAELRIVRLARIADLVRDGLDITFQALGVYPHWSEEVWNTYYDTTAIEWDRFTESVRHIRDTSRHLTSREPIFAALNFGLYTDRPSDYTNPDPVLQTIIDMYRQAEKEAGRIGYTTIDYEYEDAHAI